MKIFLIFLALAVSGCATQNAQVPCRYNLTQDSLLPNVQVVSGFVYNGRTTRYNSFCYR